MFIFSEIWTDIDREGCIELDNDEPKQLGDGTEYIGTENEHGLPGPCVTLSRRFCYILVKKSSKIMSNWPSLVQEMLIEHQDEDI